MQNFIMLIILIIIYNVIGFLIGQKYPIGNQTWYQNINLPGLPPNYIFIIIWSILYTMLAISIYLIAQSDHNNKKIYHMAIIFFIIQMILNYLFTIFFSKKYLVLSTYIILLTIMFALLAAIIFYQINIYATLLLIPYIVWLLQAWYFSNRVSEQVQ